MNLAPPIPRFGRPHADPEARERERVKESRRSANQKPAKGPGIYSGRGQAQRVFATLTDKDHHPGIKGMETTIEPVGPDSAILYWV